MLRRRTHDRLFLFFAASFALMLVELIVRDAVRVENDWTPFVYSIRLAAFGMILLAIWDKNRKG